VTVVDSNDVWIAGSGVMVHWDGRTLRRIAARASTAVQDLTAISTRDVWAVGTSIDASRVAGKAFATHWDGSRWQGGGQRRSGFADDAWLSAVAGVSAHEVWAGGAEHIAEFSDGGIQPLLLRWNGKGWARFKHPYYDDTGFAALAPLSARELWALSTNDYDYWSNGGDGSWVWHWVNGRWHATQLRGGRTLVAMSVGGPVGTRQGAVLWAVGQTGKGETDNGFPAHTLPLIRRLGC
jgi:hypothetical protein